MATALSSARTAVSRPVRAALDKKGRAANALTYAMHKSLYPHLYEKGAVKKYGWIRQGELWHKQQKTQTTRLHARKTWFRNKLKASNKPLAKLQHPQPAIKKTCPDPVSAVTAAQLAALDPTGARTRLFAKDNPECARVGDILLVRQRTGEPFAGVCINIRRRGVDTAVLLRGQLTRVGVEMWYKVYSPLVEAIEVVQRAQKKPRRARLTYMRKVKHDRGSVENVVRVYLRQKAALGSAEGGKKKGAAAAAAAAGGKKKGNKGRGKKR